MTTTLTNKITLADFELAYQRFIDSIIDNAVTLGEMLVQLTEEDSSTISQLAAKGFRKETLDKLYAIGKGTLDPRLLIDESPAAEIVRHLPIAQQKEMLENGVEVVINIGGKDTQKIKPITMLTTSEIKKVFTPQGSVRPVEEQKQIAKHEATARKSEPAQRYKISDDGNTIEVNGVLFKTGDWIEIGERALEKQKKHLASNIQRRQIKKP